MDDNNKNWELLEALCAELPTAPEDYYNRLRVSPEASALYDWLLQSNRSYIIELPPDRHLSGTNADQQFLIASDPIEKKLKFDELRMCYGSKLYFHGSRLENYTGILRKGLVIASGTALEANAAVHGKGIYISPQLGFAISYSNDARTSHAVVAICEVINSPDHVKQHTADILTVIDPDYASIRMLLIYNPGPADGNRYGVRRKTTATYDTINTPEIRLQLGF